MDSANSLWRSAICLSYWVCGTFGVCINSMILEQRCPIGVFGRYFSRISISSRMVNLVTFIDLPARYLLRGMVERAAHICISRVAPRRIDRSRLQAEASAPKNIFQCSCRTWCGKSVRFRSFASSVRRSHRSSLIFSYSASGSRQPLLHSPVQLPGCQPPRYSRGPAPQNSQRSSSGLCVFQSS